MMFPIKNIEDLQNLTELVSLENQVKAVRLQDKIGEQNFHENIKKYSRQCLTQVKLPLKIKKKLLQNLLLKTTKH